jgi:hypothetical protein
MAEAGAFLQAGRPGAPGELGAGEDALRGGAEVEPALGVAAAAEQVEGPDDA